VNGDNLTGQVWVGGGLVRHMPMSPERAAQQAREDEREARQAAFEAELRADQALGRRRALEMAGVVPRTPLEVAEAAHAVMDRADERKRTATRAEPARGGYCGGCVVAFDAGAARRGTQPPRLGGV